MNIRERVRGAVRRVGEVPVREFAAGLFARGRDRRRTVGAGSNLAPFFSNGSAFSRAGAAGMGRAGTPALHSAMPKPTAANLRRFAETPVARRAINVVKDRIAGMRWRIQARSGRALEQIPDGALRIRVLTENFEAPNPDDSFRSLLEQVLEDVIVGGFGAIEIDRVDGWSLADMSGPSLHAASLRSAWTGETPVPTSSITGGAPALLSAASLRSAGQPRAAVPTRALPLVMWPVDGATIRIMTDWDGRPDAPRYVQATGLVGANGQIVLIAESLGRMP